MMAKIGNETNLIVKLLKERVDRKESEFSRSSHPDNSHYQGKIAGMNTVIAELNSIILEIESA
jgi:hypothetical protein